MRIAQTKSLPWDIILAGLVLLQGIAIAQDIPRPAAFYDLQIPVAYRLKVFDKAWETIQKNFFDPNFNGVNWAQMKEKYRPLAEAATEKVQLLDVLQMMVNELHTSHMAVSGNLRFTSFTTGPGNWLADQVARNKSANTIVLDLRDNWGGSIETVRKVFDLFLSEKTVIGKFRTRKGKEFTLKTGGNKSGYRGRVFVLTDRYTGSAAEVFASAFQESGRGVIVGQPSKGGVLGATHYKLPNGFDLHVALMDYHTAKGVRLEGRGVIPDVAVELTIKDFREDKDAVLDRVRQLLQS